MRLEIVLAVLSGWGVLAVVLALLLGRMIGSADRRRREALRTERPKRSRRR